MCGVFVDNTRAFLYDLRNRFLKLEQLTTVMITESFAGHIPRKVLATHCGLVTFGASLSPMVGLAVTA